MFQIVLEQQKCFLIITTAVLYSFILPNVDAAQNIIIFKKSPQQQPLTKTNKETLNILPQKETPKKPPPKKTPKPHKILTKRVLGKKCSNVLVTVRKLCVPRGLYLGTNI